MGSFREALRASFWLSIAAALIAAPAVSLAEAGASAGGHGFKAPASDPAPPRYTTR